MSHKKILGISLVVLIAIYTFVFVWLKYGICLGLINRCIDGATVGIPLALAIPWVVFVACLMLFFSKEVFKAWKNFAVVYLAIGLVLEFVVPTHCDAPLNLCLDKYLLTKILIAVFVLLSLAIILYQKVKEK